ncbi:MAG: glycosyltransferase family 61 protein [Natronomonas sp.]
MDVTRLARSAPAQLLRARRKYASDGAAELLSEAVATVLESEPVRSTVCRSLLGSIDVLGWDELRERTDRSWTCSIADSVPPEVPIPPKQRLPRRHSFEGLDSTPPRRPGVVECDGVVLGPGGIGRTADGDLLVSTVGPDHARSRIETLLVRSLRHNGIEATRRGLESLSADRRLDCAVSLVPVWNNYYHWTVECLPRLLGVETYRRRTGRRPTLLVPADPPSWLTESLSILGVDDSTVQPIGDESIAVDRLVVPSYPTPSRLECRWLSDRVRRRSDDAESGPAGRRRGRPEALPSRIYVSRQNANVRRVRNDSAVFETLEAFGVEPYALEAHDVETQIRLFRNAELVVAPHGAGLGNLVYAESDPPTVLELFGDKQKTTFYRLSKLFGSEYHALFCDHVRKDLVVDTAHLAAALDGICSGTRQPVFPVRRD